MYTGACTSYAKTKCFARCGVNHQSSPLHSEWRMGKPHLFTHEAINVSGLIGEQRLSLDGSAFSMLDVGVVLANAFLRGQNEKDRHFVQGNTAYTIGGVTIKILENPRLRFKCHHSRNKDDIHCGYGLRNLKNKLLNCSQKI